MPSYLGVWGKAPAARCERRAVLTTHEERNSLHCPHSAARLPAVAMEFVLYAEGFPSRGFGAKEAFEAWWRAHHDTLAKRVAEAQRRARETGQEP